MKSIRIEKLADFALFFEPRHWRNWRNYTYYRILGAWFLVIER